MRLFRTLAKGTEKHGLTLGNFDGVHRGHRLLLKSLRAHVGEAGSVAALTFSTHPSYVLKHLSPAPLLCSKAHKLRLLQEAGVDLCFAIAFTQELAECSYKAFLEQIREIFPFDFLILGKEAAFGKKLEGTEERVRELAKSLAFEAIYLDKFSGEDGVISSGKIRKALAEGALDLVARLLGRPFSVLGKLGKNGSLEIEEKLCLPPEGHYPVIVRSEAVSCRTEVLIKKNIFVKDPPFQGDVEILFDPLHL